MNDLNRCKLQYDENGEYVLCKGYTEILKLDEMLKDANIPHELVRMLDGWQVLFPGAEMRVADAVQHFFSYGCGENLLEIMGLVAPEEGEGEILGYLTAEDVFERMKKYHTDHITEKGGASDAD